jgi:orotidine-5'-phosphate decarboxylase
MKEATASLEVQISAKERIIVALDVDSASEAESIVRELNGSVGAFKIGLQLFTAAGPAFVRKLVESGTKIFLDLKFHDIPNTVAKASAEAARLGVWMFNVHASGGSEMMRKTIGEVSEVCARENLERPKIIAVTVLTSSDRETLAETGVTAETEEQVLRLAGLTSKCGLDGVVASPLEIESIRRNVQMLGFLIVTPGIRPVFATNDDQKRVMSPGGAVRTGADYLVIGRPVTAASDRAKAIEAIVDEIGS